MSAHVDVVIVAPVMEVRRLQSPSDPQWARRLV
jgi:hypothetical protein